MTSVKKMHRKELKNNFKKEKKKIKVEKDK